MTSSLKLLLSNNSVVLFFPLGLINAVHSLIHIMNYSFLPEGFPWLKDKC